MKILRIFNGKESKFAYLDEDYLLKNNGFTKDTKVNEIAISSVEEIFSKNENEIKELNTYSYLIKDIKILPPTLPSKIVCVGLNYKNHGKELNMDIPKEPKIFLKPPSSIIGHLDNIIYPKASKEVDYEGELAIVIGKKCKNLSENFNKSGFKDFIGGYTVLNDVTARDIQINEVQWTRAKSFDTFCPIGPVIETCMDPSKKNISLKVNEKIKQKSNTKNMIFSSFELVEFVSNIMTLNPGDIISTGTPSGVGPLNIGDKVEIAIENIGTLINYVSK